MPVSYFPEWKPDEPTLQDGLIECSGVLPRTAKSYGPMGSLSAYSSALTAACQGAVGVKDNSNNVNLFAGDATKLYNLTVSSTSFSDVSKVTGYNITADERWSFAQYGNRIMAANIADPIQTYTMGTSTIFSDLSGTAIPKCRYLTIAKNFTIAANTYDATNGYQPQRLQWSAIGDPTTWPTIGTSSAAAVQSDEQYLAGDGGWIQGVVSGLGWCDVLVFMERKVFAGKYVGAPIIFQFDGIEGLRGTPAPGSIAQLGSAVFYLGEDGFYLIDQGGNSKPIGNGKVDKWFFSDIDQSTFVKITSAVDPINKIVIWSYQGSGSSNPNKYIAYNWALDRWSHGSLDCEILVRTLSYGYTLDSLDGVSASLDSLPFSLDSRVWAAGRLVLSAFSTAHKLSYFTGTNLAAQFITQEITGEAGRRVFISGIRPIVDGGTATAAIQYRDLPTASNTTSSSSSIGTDGVCPFRISARYARAQIDIAAGGSWTHATGIEAYLKPEGRR